MKRPIDIKLDALDWLYAVAVEHTKDRPHAQRVGCTGLFAGWCPLCGNCNCSQSDVIFDTWCPLHGQVEEARVAKQYGYDFDHSIYWCDYEDDGFPRDL